MIVLAWIFTILFVWMDLLRLLLLLLIGWPLLFFPTTKKFFINQLLAVDQSVNAVTGGDPDETISSRLGKARETSRFAAFVARIVDFCFKWQTKKHTDDVEEPDEGKDAIL